MAVVNAPIHQHVDVPDNVVLLVLAFDRSLIIGNDQKSSTTRWVLNSLNTFVIVSDI